MRRILTTVTTLALAAGGALLAAAPAQALPEEVLVSPATPALVWTQSFQRSGPDAACVAPKELDIAWQADWSADEKAWIPTWEQWPDGGEGGWTCFRQITWAKGSAAVYASFT
jgi:hypothetical protein